MGLARQGGESSCYLGETRADISGHGPPPTAMVLMSRISLRDGKTEVALNPSQDRVPYPVHADLLGRHPREMLAEPLPEIVVTPGGDRLAVRIPQQASA